MTVIAISVAGAEAGAGLAIHFRRAALHTVAVAILIFAVGLIDDVFVDVPPLLVEA